MEVVLMPMVYMLLFTFALNGLIFLGMVRFRDSNRRLLRELWRFGVRSGNSRHIRNRRKR